MLSLLSTMLMKMSHVQPNVLIMVVSKFIPILLCVYEKKCESMNLNKISRTSHLLKLPVLLIQMDCDVFAIVYSSILIPWSGNYEK